LVYKVWVGKPGTTTLISSTSWGVLIARHQRQTVVSEALSARGVEHLIPMMEVLKIVRKRHVRDLRPLFGEYIPFAVSSVWKSLLGIRDVAGMLLNESGFPAQVLPLEVERLRELYRVNTVRQEKIQSGELMLGEFVIPRCGPFINFQGKYDGETKRGADVALFVLFGRETRVEFNKGDLLAV
jgi:transcription antitermination factor NusG